MLLRGNVDGDVCRSGQLTIAGSGSKHVPAGQGKKHLGDRLAVRDEKGARILKADFSWTPILKPCDVQAKTRARGGIVLPFGRIRRDIFLGNRWLRKSVVNYHSAQRDGAANGCYWNRRNGNRWRLV